MRLHIELGGTSCQCELKTIREDDARKLVAAFFARVISKDTPAIPVDPQYDIHYFGYAEGKMIEDIKSIRSLTGFMLKEAKDASEKPNSVLGRVVGTASKDQWVKTLTDAGANVEARVV